ncbi:hypothetical protein [Edaphobacter aggregans]|uniref:hypothetical protein n=1 Tax=Edaphobacter aggregans TaxID=570835 RepID=UPI00055336A4|nr:hypothetical protein [Edaphobacter aggregans]
MPQTPHQQRVVELHKLAAHAHLAAAASHDKGDHLTAHELSKQAHEHSRLALEHSGQMATFEPGKELRP